MHTITDVNTVGNTGFNLIQQYQRDEVTIDPKLETELKQFFKDAKIAKKQSANTLHEAAKRLHSKLKKKQPWWGTNQYTTLFRCVESILITTDKIE